MVRPTHGFPRTQEMLQPHVTIDNRERSAHGGSIAGRSPGISTPQGGRAVRSPTSPSLFVRRPSSNSTIFNTVLLLGLQREPGSLHHAQGRFVRPIRPYKCRHQPRRDQPLPGRSNRPPRRKAGRAQAVIFEFSSNGGYYRRVQHLTKSPGSNSSMSPRRISCRTNLYFPMQRSAAPPLSRKGIHDCHAISGTAMSTPISVRLTQLNRWHRGTCQCKQPPDRPGETAASQPVVNRVSSQNTRADTDEHSTRHALTSTTALARSCRNVYSSRNRARGPQVISPGVSGY